MLIMLIMLSMSSMLSTLAAIGIALTATSPTTSPTRPSLTPTFKVFLLAGQSNMEGQGVVALDHPEHYNGGRGNLVGHWPLIQASELLEGDLGNRRPPESGLHNT